jgi:hypothetical protein
LIQPRESEVAPGVLVKTIAIVARPKKDEAAALARELMLRYPDHEFLVQEHLAEQLGAPPVTDEELARRAELVVVLGGRRHVDLRGPRAQGEAGADSGGST